MSFKTMQQFDDERMGNFFTLRNDGDSADVIFLYRNSNEVLIADTHYIKSPEYSGYVHCVGRGCPACANKPNPIRVQTKLFIPLYIISSSESSQEGKVVFFDRSSRFINQLQQEVFLNYANPSEYVFTITRHGEAGSYETTYSISCRAKNNVKSYDEICEEFEIKFPDYFETVCRDVDAVTMSGMLTKTSSAAPTTSADMPNYTIRPRTSVTTGEAPAVPPTSTIANTLDEVDEDAEELTDEDEPDFD